MRQQTLASQASFEKYGRKSRRELFLDEMERVVPWPELEALVEPHFPNSQPKAKSIIMNVSPVVSIIMNTRSRVGDVRCLARGGGSIGARPTRR
jgi:hypothetical protein